MFSNNKNYNFLVIILLLAIGVSLVFHIFFRQELDEGFSEIYFPDPDNLPNEIHLGGDYTFLFSVKNLEAKPSTYEYDAKLELFNLYDVTEGIYKCAAKQRKKVGLSFVEGNESDSGKYILNDGLGSEPIYSESDDYGTIGWEKYSVEYKYRDYLGSGSFTTIFHDENKTKYYFTVYSDTSDVEFTYRDDGKVKRQRKKIMDMKPENEVVINVSNGIDYYFNKKLIFSKSIDDAVNGKIDFRMDDTYATVSGLIAYRDSPIEVVQSEYIRDYEINNNVVIEKINELKKKSEEEVYILRSEDDLNASCEIKGCNELRSYLNDPQDADSFDAGLDNDGRFLVSLIDAGEIQTFPSQSYTQNSTVDGLMWENFTLRMDFQIFSERHTLLVSFDENFMMLFHDSDAFFIVENNPIHRSPSPIKAGVNELFLESKNGNTVVKINGAPVFNFISELDFKNLSLYTKNSFIPLGDITLTNKAGSCSLLDAPGNCKRIYRVQSVRDFSRSNTIRVVAEPEKVSNDLGMVALLGVFSIFGGAGSESINYSLSESSVLQMLDYDIEIDTSLINEDIPSEKYVFDGSNAVLKEMVNYSFSFNFNFLEGIGLLEVSFYNTDGGEAATFIFNNHGNEAYLFTKTDGELLRSIASVDAGEKEHKLDIIYEDGKANYYFDYKKIFEAGEYDMSDGFFSISTFNSYFEIRDISLYDRNSKERMPFAIDEDPCRLRKIDEILLDKNSLFLGDGEMITINQSFNTEADFDFGMVSVSLMPQKNETMNEIHFWVINDE